MNFQQTFIQDFSEIIFFTSFLGSSQHDLLVIVWEYSHTGKLICIVEPEQTHPKIPFLDNKNI